MSVSPDFVVYPDERAGRYYARSRIGNVVAVATDLKTIVDTLKGNGVWLQFAAGVFDFGTITTAGARTTFVDLADMTVAGAGEGATTLRVTSSLAEDTEPISCTRCDGFTLRDITVDALGTARSTSDAVDFDDSDFVTVERVTVTNSRGSGLALDGKDAGATSRGHTIRDFTVEACAYEGILCWAVTDSLFDNVRTTGVGTTASGQGIKFNRHSGGQCRDCTVRGGIFENGTVGIAIYGSDRVLVDGAIVRGNSSHGVYVQTFSDAIAATDHTIAHLHSVNNGGYGISIVPNAAATITGTRIIDHRPSGNTSGAVNDVGTGTVTWP